MRKKIAWKIAWRLRRAAWKLAPIPNMWNGHEWTGTPGYEQATLSIETDGVYTGTSLRINGKPVHNCVGVSFEIKTGEVAHATVELEDVPIHFTGKLSEVAQEQALGALADAISGQIVGKPLNGGSS